MSGTRSSVLTAKEALHAVTDELVAFIGPKLRDPERTPSYPKARVCTSRRGLKIHFGAPVNGTDVTVDLIVALRRREGAGCGSPTWSGPRAPRRPGVPATPRATWSC
ncbi:hypothetical protein SHKM778_60490 [Streptomyces sp. KM77-8]|uniref:Transposase n=1 Tax=Streptomyces haneummycinicus TaxID=3074435 RepID=A0AAT9HPY2_9ACTN